MKAVWRDTVIAESDDVVQVEGNYYFPWAALKREYFECSDTVSNCAWKGQAKYYNIRVKDEFNFDVAWSYPTPSLDAKIIEGRVAFWKDVKVIN